MLKKLLLILFALMFVTGCDIACDSTYGVTKKVLDSDMAIYNYEYFKQQSEDIKVLKKNHEHAEKRLNDFKKIFDKNDRADKEELIRLYSIADGIRYRLNGAIGDYNAKSKMVHKKIFKNGLLPSINMDNL